MDLGTEIWLQEQSKYCFNKVSTFQWTVQLSMDTTMIKIRSAHRYEETYPVQMEFTVSIQELLHNCFHRTFP